MKNSASAQHMRDDELDDEECMTDGTGLLPSAKQDDFEVPCCGWMSVRYYQPVRGLLDYCRFCFLIDRK